MPVFTLAHWQNSSLVRETYIIIATRIFFWRSRKLIAGIIDLRLHMLNIYVINYHLIYCCTTKNINSSNELNIQQLILHLVHIIWVFYSLFPFYHFISYHYAVKYTHRILISMLMNIFTIKSTRRNRRFFSSCFFLQLQSNATKLRYWLNNH